MADFDTDSRHPRPPQLARDTQSVHDATSSSGGVTWQAPSPPSSSSWWRNFLKAAVHVKIPSTADVAGLAGSSAVSTPPAAASTSTSASGMRGATSGGGGGSSGSAGLRVIHAFEPVSIGSTESNPLLAETYPIREADEKDGAGKEGGVSIDHSTRANSVDQSASAQESAFPMPPPPKPPALTRSLSLLDLILLGIGASIGSGIFVVTGVAARLAGPAVSLSFLLAGLASLLNALCYADLAARFPGRVGGAYLYAHACLGQLASFVLFCHLVLDYHVGAAAIARSLASYLASLVEVASGAGLPGVLAPGGLPVSIPLPFLSPSWLLWWFCHLWSGGENVGKQVGGNQGWGAGAGAVSFFHPTAFPSLSSSHSPPSPPLLPPPPFPSLPSPPPPVPTLDLSINLVAPAVLLLITWLLCRGVRETSRVNDVMTSVKVAIVVLVVAVGAGHAMLSASALVFFSYIGFDAVANTAEESLHPRRDVPRGLLLALAACSLLYISVSLVLTGMVPYTLLDPAAPLSTAFASLGLRFMERIIDIGAVVGLTTTLLTGLYVQSRMYLALARDGMLPVWFLQVNAGSHVPVHAQWWVGGVAAAMAAVFDVGKLSHILSVGVLLSYSIACMCVLAMRVESYRGGGSGCAGVGEEGVERLDDALLAQEGLGWKSWKRRWFLLTRSSLIFFKHEPRGRIDISSAIGGIEFNNAGKVHIKPDKKQLSLTFPDGHAFTFKTDTLEDLEEWRDALEDAISKAPPPSVMMGLPRDTLFRGDGLDIGDNDGPPGPGKERRLRSMLLCRPFSLALEDVNGSPSFLEKALQFIEVHGVKLEGILRAAADVEQVERRLKEYEEGHTEFEDGENPHVVGDCVKLVLRELPTSPVLPYACTALEQAFQLDEAEAKLEAVRNAMLNLPEPNRRLLHRVLQTMIAITNNESINRMNASAVAACMAPLLFRPLFSGELQASGDEDGEDGAAAAAAQIMALTMAANQVQTMTIYLMENIDKVFVGEALGRSLARGVYSGAAWDDEDDEEGELVDDDDVDEDNDDEDSGAQVAVLEASRQELRASLAKEVRANEMLKESLVQRRKTLQELKNALQRDAAQLRMDLQEQREMYARMQTGIKGPMPEIELEPELKAELKEIESLEKSVALLRTETETLQRELLHVTHKQQQLEQQQKQQQLAGGAAGGGVGGAPLTGASAEQRQRIEALRSLRAQLKQELDRTMAMCLEEQQKNAELEERRRQDDPVALEQAVMRQKAAVQQAQAAFEAEMARGKELRRKLQLAQQRAAAAALASANAAAVTASTTGSGGSGSTEPASQAGQPGSAEADAQTAPDGEARPAGPSAAAAAAAAAAVAAAGGAGEPPSAAAAAAAFAELTARLEEFKRQRAVLIQRLAALSNETVPGGPQGMAGAGGPRVPQLSRDIPSH
ncbi:unnamed protein product [Closterium sp. Naga37s-1]|nr:unnamed protein product [Closterium sp. Naga37s-1]